MGLIFDYVKAAFVPSEYSRDLRVAVFNADSRLTVYSTLRTSHKPLLTILQRVDGHLTSLEMLCLPGVVRFQSEYSTFP